MNTCWYSHAVEYHPAKENEQSVATWVSLTNITDERNQAQNNIAWFHLSTVQKGKNMTQMKVISGIRS